MAITAQESALEHEPVSPRHLACALADMLTGATTLRVTALKTREQPTTRCHLRAFDERGRPVAVLRREGLIAARWIVRAHPHADWSEPHDFGLVTAALTPAVRSGNGPGRVS